MTGMVEKPPPGTEPSNLFISGRYILQPDIFEILETQERGAGGEIQLTDALRSLLAREAIYGVVLDAKRHDIGNPVDWLKTNLIFAAWDAGLWEKLRPTLEQLLGARKSS